MIIPPRFSQNGDVRRTLARLAGQTGSAWRGRGDDLVVDSRPIRFLLPGQHKLLPHPRDDRFDASVAFESVRSYVPAGSHRHRPLPRGSYRRRRSPLSTDGASSSTAYGEQTSGREALI